MSTGTAYHEAAHAVAHVVLGYSLYEVSADSPIDDKLGHTSGDVLTENLKQTKNWTATAIGEHDREVARDDTIILLVGEIAESRYLGLPYVFEPYDEPTSSDRQEVLGRLALMERGADAQNGLLEALVASATDLVAQNWEGIVLVAEALTTKKLLDGDAVKALLSPDAPDEDVIAASQP